MAGRGMGGWDAGEFGGMKETHEREKGSGVG